VSALCRVGVGNLLVCAIMGRALGNLCSLTWLCGWSSDC
jgi:hypothetical protein